MSHTTYLFYAIAVMAAVMLGLRAFPFILFGRGERAPEWVLYIGKIITPATIAMLIVYCFNGVQFTVWPSALPELIAGSVIIVTHILFRNVILSVFGGTIFYMILVQFLFYRI